MSQAEFFSAHFRAVISCPKSAVWLTSVGAALQQRVDDRGDGRLEFFYFEKSMFSVIAIHPAEQLLQLRLMGLALYEAFFFYDF